MKKLIVLNFPVSLSLEIWYEHSIFLHFYSILYCINAVPDCLET